MNDVAKESTANAIKFETQPQSVKDALKAVLDQLQKGIKAAVVTGGAAGNFTVTGIATGDELILVLRFTGAGTDVTDVADLTSEFSISATDTINNTGGTATTGSKLLVLYWDLT